MILVADHGWPFLATLPVAGALGFAVGAVIGLPALRIRGLYLSLMTLGIWRSPSRRSSSQHSSASTSPVTGGSNGKAITVGNGRRAERLPLERTVLGPRSPRRQRLDLHHRLLIAIVMFLLTSNLVRSRVGRARSPCGTTRSAPSRVGRQQLPRQGDGLRHQRLLDVGRRWLLRPRRPDDRPRQLRAAALDRVHRRPRHRRRRHDPRPGARRRDRRVPALPLLQRRSPVRRPTCCTG